MHIALVTCDALAQYAATGVASEDQQLTEQLRARGLRVTSAVWSDPAVRWQDFDAAVLKSPWDYFDRPAEFHRWLDALDAQGVRLLNPTGIVRPNADKAYLRDLALAGVPVVPTRWLPRGSRVRPAELLAELGADKLVLKPTVSGGAKDTFALTAAEAEAATGQLQALVDEQDFLAQPFLPQIQTSGEWSLVFFGGQLSHCVRKTPKAGDFRVQHLFGGGVHAETPSAAIQAQAADIVQRFAPGCLYARVDGVETDAGGFWLMELELIEPFLYLDSAGPAAYVRYADALLALLEQGQ
jgi:glutathione synthase/RimK-type ligase-like ATP-grasp enzyme